MSEREFDAEARRRLKAAGATDVDIHSGTDAVTVRCYLQGVSMSCSVAVGCGRPESDIYAEILGSIDALTSRVN